MFLWKKNKLLLEGYYSFSMSEHMIRIVFSYYESMTQLGIKSHLSLLVCTTEPNSLLVWQLRLSAEQPKSNTTQISAVCTESCYKDFDWCQQKKSAQRNSGILLIHCNTAVWWNGVNVCTCNIFLCVAFLPYSRHSCSLSACSSRPNWIIRSVAAWFPPQSCLLLVQPSSSGNRHIWGTHSGSTDMKTSWSKWTIERLTQRCASKHGDESNIRSYVW